MMSSIYKGSTTFDQDVEKATVDNSGEPDWAKILEICDRAGQSTSNSKDCLSSIMKRLDNSSKNVQYHSLTLLDSCIKNCGLNFQKEVASTDFIKECRTLLSKASAEISDKFKELLKSWAETEFKKDSSLSAIVNFYQTLRKEGAYFGMGTKSAAASEPSNDIERAIALSLKESKETSQGSSLYPQMSNVAPQSTAVYSSINSATSSHAEKQARALYDFEAAEDNELTFKTGELISVIDDSDPNWWKGRTWRGEGLFPANFVTTDMAFEPADEKKSNKKSVQFNEDVKVQQFDPEKVKINEQAIDRTLDMIQNADPTGLNEDSQEMLNLEEECKVMVPLIDRELERIDKKHNDMMLLNQKLLDSFQLYTKLMTEPAASAQYQAPNKYMLPQSSIPSMSQLPQQQAPAGTYSSLPGMYGMPPMQAHQGVAQAPAVYAQNVYGASSFVPQQPRLESIPAEASAQMYNQSAILQQYQMTGTSLSNLSYLPNAGGIQGIPVGYNPQYNQIPSSQ